MRKNPPLISVIVPTYNRTDTLGRTLQSILEQTFRDYEIIVVDDGSTDSTCAVVENLLGSSSFKYIYQANKGVALARHTGMKASQGKYLAFCDSDDFWAPEKLETQMALFDPDTALVYSDAYFLSEMFSEPKPKFRAYDMTRPFQGEVYTHLVKKNFLVTSSVVARKAFLEDFVQFPLCSLDDWQMWLWVARKKGRFQYAGKPLVYYYEHPYGISRQKIGATHARIAVRKYEVLLLQKDNLRDVGLISELRTMIFKDTLQLCALRLMPERIMKRLIGAYYSHGSLRRLALKMGLGN